MKAQDSYTMSFTDDYEIIDHTADIGIRVRGNSLPAVIEKSILALSDLMIGHAKIGSDEEKEFIIQEDDREVALVRILEEILYLFEQQRFAVAECSVNRENIEYIVKLKGKLYSPGEIKEGTEIKAVTYHRLKVKKRDGYWIVNVIFDI